MIMMRKAPLNYYIYRLRVVYVVYSTDNKSETITGYSSEVSA